MSRSSTSSLRAALKSVGAVRECRDEIVHDIDLKDGKFGRPETGGIASLVAGIAMAHAEDESRLARASAVFDDLREYFRRRPNTTRRGTLARDGKEPT